LRANQIAFPPQRDHRRFVSREKGTNIHLKTRENEAAQSIAYKG
jgi:hypothetical protein